VKKEGVIFLEIQNDPELRKKEQQASEALRRFYPNSGPVRLYRTTEGEVGIQATLPIVPGDRKRIEAAYRALMEAIGEGRGRPKGPDTVQTKLRLERAVVARIKKEARRRRTTMSRVVSDAVARLPN